MNHKMTTNNNRKCQKVIQKELIKLKWSKDKPKIEVGPEIKTNWTKNDLMYLESLLNKIKTRQKLKNSKLTTNYKKNQVNSKRNPQYHNLLEEFLQDFNKTLPIIKISLI